MRNRAHRYYQNGRCRINANTITGRGRGGGDVDASVRDRQRKGGAPLGTRAVPINDSAFRQIVWRQFNVDAIAGKYPDSVAAHAAGDVGEDGMAVFELYGKCRTGENLFNAAGYLDRALLRVL
jgi:hypothetical protein